MSNGGSSSPVTREAYSGVSGGHVTIADGDLAGIPWHTRTVGDTAWLDLGTDPEPTVSADGIYAICVSITSDGAMTDGGGFVANLFLNSEGDEPSTIVGAAVSSAAVLGGQAVLMLATTWWMAAGEQVYIRVTNNDGVSSRDFYLSEATVQKLS